VAGEDRTDRAGTRLAGIEAASLEVLRRQAEGAAHTLNNLFTSLLGELALLAEERKDDPVVDEAVATLRDTLDRCIKLVRNGLARPRPGPAVRGEIDLGLLLRRCTRLLDGTLPRRISLRTRVPDESWLVRGDAAELELMLLALIFRLGDLGQGACMDLAISLGDAVAAGTLALHLDLSAEGLPADARLRLVDPGVAEDPISAASLETIHAIADRHGTHLQTERTGPESLRLSLVFERLES
jgi:C4-dicarboxylate-specific signal transduction histidine kinase